MNNINKPVVITIVLITISQLILFILKIFKVVNWNWGWILSPLWIPYAFLIFCGIILVLYLAICNIKERIFKKHE